jgi:hypothetical protein
MERIEIHLTARGLLNVKPNLERWTIRDGNLCCTKTVVAFAPNFTIRIGAQEGEPRVSSSQSEGTQDGAA